MFGPVSPQLVQSGKGRIASDPPLLNLPRPLMVGAFSIVGSDEQIFGVNGQILRRDQSDHLVAPPYDVACSHNAERADPGQATYPRVAGVSTLAATNKCLA